MKRHQNGGVNGDLRVHGWHVPHLVFEETDLAPLDSMFESLDGPGKRLLGDDASLSPLPIYSKLNQLADELFWTEMIPVRAIFFTKSGDNNWLVPWHQDVTLAAPYRSDLPGFTNWTLKDGFWHVQPPAEVLDNMLALRLHLSECWAEDGPLKVISKTHTDGRLDPDEVARRVEEGIAQELYSPRGGVIAMRPLTLHASSKSTGASQRRVLHVEFCASRAYPFIRFAEPART